MEFRPPSLREGPRMTRIFLEAEQDKPMQNAPTPYPSPPPTPTTSRNPPPVRGDWLGLRPGGRSLEPRRADRVDPHHPGSRARPINRALYLLPETERSAL